MFFTLQAVFQLSKKVGDDAPREHAIQTEHKESRGSCLQLPFLKGTLRKVLEKNVVFDNPFCIHGTIVLFTSMCHKKSTILM